MNPTMKGFPVLHKMKVLLYSYSGAFGETSRSCVGLMMATGFSTGCDESLHVFVQESAVNHLGIMTYMSHFLAFSLSKFISFRDIKEIVTFVGIIFKCTPHMFRSEAF